MLTVTKCMYISRLTLVTMSYYLGIGPILIFYLQK